MVAEVRTRVADKGVKAAGVLIKEGRDVVDLAVEHQPAVLVVHVLLALGQGDSLRRHFCELSFGGGLGRWRGDSRAGRLDKRVGVLGMREADADC